MAIGDVVLDVWTNGGGSAVIASALTALVLKSQRVGGEIATHDRLASNVDEDLRRWVRDRAVAAEVRLNEIRQDARVRGVALGGTVGLSRGKVYKHVLHEYRDEALRKLRSVNELQDQEGKLHAWARRRGQPLRRPRLREECRAIVARWREAAEVDVSSPELEPGLVELELDD